MPLNSDRSKWVVFGYNVPKNEVVFFTQAIIIYVVIVCALVNLSLDRGDPVLWSTLLASCLGYLLPNPTINNRQTKSSQSVDEIDFVQLCESAVGSSAHSDHA